MPVAFKSSTPRSTEAGSVPVKYGFRVEGVDVRALDDDLLRARGPGPAQPTQTKGHRQKNADTPANPIHMAQSPCSRQSGPPLGAASV